MTTQSQSNTRALQDVARHAAGHTPGPWSVSAIGAGFEVDDANGTSIAQTQQRHAVRDAGGHNERRANARLIAAAPAMLAALQGLFHRHNDGSQEGPWAEWDTAVEAIVKATGNQP